MTPSIDEIATTLDEQGVCPVPGVFSQSDANEMRRSIFEAMSRTSPDRKYHQGGQIQWKQVGAKKWPGLMFWPALVSQSLREVREAPTFSEIIRGLVGNSIRQMNNQWYFRLPGDEDTFKVHKDAAFRSEISDRHMLRQRYCQTIIAIDPVTPDNGGVEFFLGSHRDALPPTIKKDRSDLRQLDRDQRDRLRQRYQSKIFELAPGDVLIWLLDVLHCSDTNRSDRPRMTYMNGFGPAEASESWPYYMVDGKFVELNSGLIPKRD